MYHARWFFPALALACATLLYGLASHGSKHEQPDQDSDPGESAALLAPSPWTWDFGELHLGESKSASFSIRNRTGSIVEIRRVEEGRTCTTAILGERFIRPNSAASVTVRYEPHNVGLQVASIVFHTDSFEHPRVRAMVRARVVAPDIGIARANPQDVDLGIVDDAERLERGVTLSISNLGGRPYRVVAVEVGATDARVDVDKGLPITIESGNVMPVGIKLRGRAGDLVGALITFTLSGASRDRLVIKILGARRPPIGFPLAVSGCSESMLRICNRWRGGRVEVLVLETGDLTSATPRWLEPAEAMHVTCRSYGVEGRKVRLSWRTEGQATATTTAIEAGDSPSDGCVVIADGQENGLPVVMLGSHGAGNPMSTSFDLVNMSGQERSIGIRSTDSRGRMRLAPSVETAVSSGSSTRFRATVAANSPPGTLNELLDVLVDGRPSGRLVLRTCIDEIDWAGIQRIPNVRVLSVMTFTGSGGSLAPCNCSSGQTGGLPRAIGVLRESRSQISAAVQFGEFVGDDPRLSTAKADVVLRSLAAVGPKVAVVPGGQELSLGAVSLRRMAEALGIDVIAGNAVDAATDAPLFPAAALVSVGNIRLALIGAIDPGAISDGDLRRAGVRILDPAAAIARARRELPSFEFAMVFIHGESQRWTRMKTSDNGIIAIVGSHEALSHRFAAESVLSDPDVLSVSVTRGGRVATEVDAAVSEGALVRINARNWLLDGTAPEDAATAQRIAQYRRSLATIPISADPTMSAAYVGVQVCTACHAASGRAWAVSRHANSMRTLRDRGSEFDPECLRCHTLGKDVGGLFYPLDGTPVDVTCEACHGSGAAHSASPMTRMPRPIECVSCHTPEMSNRFDHDAYWEKISHGK